MAELTVGRAGEIILPITVLNRYGLVPGTPVRIVETRSGILLIPSGVAPMSEELAQELAEWQALAAESWASFPYEDDAA